MREKLVRGNEKRDLKQKRDRSAQHIRRLIVVLPVIRLEDHHLLVAAEGLLYVSYAFMKLQLHLAFLLLHGVGALVQRQNEKVHCKAQNYYGKSRIVHYPVRHHIYHFERKLERLQQK